jgi:hypothetical protein
MLTPLRGRPACGRRAGGRLLTIMDGGGARLEKFGDSNGRILEPLSVSQT